MALPDFPEVADDQLRAVAERAGFGAVAVSRLPQVGIFNAIYALGDRHVLRVPRAHPRFEGTASNEAIAVPLARAAGVRTPALVHCDTSKTEFPFAYSIYERVGGRTLEGLVSDPAGADGAWRELGRDLARLHTAVAAGQGTALAIWDDKTDPRPLPDIIARAGYFTVMEAEWLNRWLVRLAQAVDQPQEDRFLHGDSQGTNVIVNPATLDYVAVIDWGSCKLGDIAHDFAGVPLRAVPAMLEGYRELAPTGPGLEARIVWRHLQIALHQLRGQPVPDYSWGERPMGMLLEVFRFFAAPRSEVWRACGPEG